VLKILGLLSVILLVLSSRVRNVVLGYFNLNNYLPDKDED